MKLELNIYEKQKKIKEYSIEDYDVLYGTVQDILLKFETISELSDIEVIKMVLNNREFVESIIKSIFIEITDEELRKTKFKEIAIVFINIVKNTTVEIAGAFKGKK